jgi:hypothetical protein
MDGQILEDFLALLPILWRRLKTTSQVHNELSKLMMFLSAVAPFVDDDEMMVALIGYATNEESRQRPKLSDSIFTFVSVIRLCQREERGTLRGRKNEAVNEHNVYIGGGNVPIPMRSLAEWNGLRDEPIGQLGNPALSHLNEYDIAFQLARLYLLIRFDLLQMSTEVILEKLVYSR